MSETPRPTSNPPTRPNPETPASSTADPGQDQDQEFTFTNAPNILTLMRIAAVPIVVGLLMLRHPTWDLAAALVFAAASITDYFDGYLARLNKQVTVYGKLMDPLADKFLVVSSLIMLQDLGRIHPVVVMVLICRELAITGLRALASAEGVVIAASESAKLKTAAQMVAIPLIMVQGGILGFDSIPFYTLGLGLLYLSLAISLWSAFAYVVGFYRGFKESRKGLNRQRKLARDAIRASRAARFSAKINKALALKRSHDQERDSPRS